MKKLYVLVMTTLVATVSLYAQSHRRLAYTTRAGEKMSVEVYNNTDREGFTIIMPKEVTGEELVLGYSDSGSFNYDSAPENLKWWLGEYQRQIDYLNKNENTQRSSLNPKLSSAVAPLLTSHWTQRIPYNTMCPMYNDSWSMVGCLATAMAQVMYYWKYPEKGTGKHSYTYQGETISSDFSAHTYNWEAMQDDYIGTYSMESANAVAQLCFDCGVSINMAYRTTASGAYADDVPNALKTYFGYYKLLAIKYRNNYPSQTSWEKMLRDELDAGRPVIYGGSNEAGNSGHAFVCDGYNEDGYFHFNFGFGDGYDGYFLTTAINPAGNDFSYLQDAIIRIKPQTSGIDERVETREERDERGDTRVFNLAGQRVGEDYKGIVIRNDKKYINFNKN